MNKRSKRVLPLILLTAVATGILGMSFAWYITNIDLHFQSNTNFKLEVGNNIEIARIKSDGTLTDYGTKIMYNTAESICDCTGDGLYFEAPTIIDKATNKACYPMTVVNDSNKAGYYLDFEFSVKCSFTTSLYLADGSYIKPASASSVNSEALSRISADLFSADYIAGAMRAAFLQDPDKDGVYTEDDLVQIWAPNDKYETTFSSNGLNPNGFILNGLREDRYGYEKNDTTNHTIVRTNYSLTNYLDGDFVVGNSGVFADSDNQLVNRAKPVLSFTGDGTTQEKRFTIRVWAEGTDREANDITNMGQVDYFFKFITMSKFDNDSESDTALQSIDSTAQASVVGGESCYILTKSSTPLTADDNIEYSFNGIDWNDYTDHLVFPVKREHILNSNGTAQTDANGLPVCTEIVDEKNTVFIKKKESITQLHSTRKTVTVPIAE